MAGATAGQPASPRILPLMPLGGSWEPHRTSEGGASWAPRRRRPARTAGVDGLRSPLSSAGYEEEVSIMLLLCDFSLPLMQLSAPFLLAGAL